MTPKIGDWVGIEEGNDWMSIYYSYEGELKVDGARDPNGALQFKEGMKIYAKFPDGRCEHHTLKMRSNEASYSDMGHANTATQNRFGFEIPVYGTVAWVPIERTKIRYGAVKRLKDLCSE